MISRSKHINRPCLRLLCLCLALCMLVAMLPATAIAADTDIYLYLIPNSNWKQANARFAVYLFGNGEKWVSGTKINDDLYEFVIPAGFQDVIFCRMNPSTTANNWNNKWNQTDDLTVQADGKNCYTIKSGTWDKGGGSWSTVNYCHVHGHDFVGDVCSRCGVGLTTVYFRNDWNWSAVSLYYWHTYTNNSWPGEDMDFYGNDGKHDYYVAKVPTDVTGIIINGTKDDGSGAPDQSPDITSGWYDGIVYYMHWDNGNQVGSLNISEVVFPCNHDWTDANCTTPKTCAVCGETEGEANGHSYDAVVTDPTCTEDGYTTYTCSVCGDSYVDDEVAASGHTMSEPTCTEASACSVCGYTEGEANGHSYDAVVTEPTCTEDGFTTYTCSVCGDSYVDDEVAASGHTMSEPTCTEPSTCAICGETEGEALGHSEETVPGYAADCTNPGLTDGTICTVCGETLVEQEEISALGHGKPVYKNNGANHEVDYPCCDDLDDEFECHSFTDGKCACGAPETFSVGLSDEYGTADLVTLSNPVATPGRDYVTVVTSPVGTSIDVWAVYVAADDSWYGNYIYEFDQETKTLTVFADYVAEGMIITAVPLVTLTTHMNGGSLREDWQGTFYPVANGSFTYEFEYGSEYALFGDWDPVTDEPILDANLVFEREGYSVIGYNTAADGSGTFYAMDHVFKMTDDIDIYLIWECNHEWLDATCTEPKTCSACGATEGEALGHKDDDNNGLCDSCNHLMQAAKLSMASISLKGNIAINYYMLLSDEVLSDKTAYMEFVMANDEIRQVSVGEGTAVVRDNVTYYVYSCSVDAKEMTDSVVSRFFYKDGATSEYTYSVKAYADYVLANSTNADVKSLVAAMLNYGAASQLHFGYRTDALANADMTPVDYSGLTITGFNATSGQGTDLVKFYSASLILKSETTLRFFFRVDSSATFSATYNGQELNVVERSGLYYVDVTGISAKDLDEKVTISISDGVNTAEVFFNPLSYCQGVLKDTTGAFSARMKDLVCALYLYNQAANVYFKEN